MTGDGNRVSTPDERPDPGELRREAGVLLDQSFEGILIGWQEVPGLADTATAKLMGPRLEALTQIGVDLMVVTTGSIGAVVGDLGARAFGPGHVWISDGRGKICSVEATGLHAVSSGSLIGAPAGRGARDRLLGALRDRGFGERLAIVVGQDQTPRGSSTMVLTPRHVDELLQFLDAQLDRRAQCRVPGVDDDPTWAIQVTNHTRMRANDALLCLADGRFGTRGEGSSSARSSNSSPMVLASGVFRDLGQTHLLEGPLWNQLDLDAVDPTAERRVLNLRSGALSSVQRCAGGAVTSVWFNSITHPGVMAMRAEGPPGAMEPGRPVRPPGARQGVEFEEGGDELRAWAKVTGPSSAGIGVAASQRRAPAGATGSVETVERLAAYVSDPYRPAERDSAFVELGRAESVGFDRLLARHREAWAARWADAEISIVGDSEIELAARFATFHLLSSVADTGEAAVGARGLSGPSYGGHVFWDADVFVLPALAAIHPASARAMLEYRLRRLTAARRQATSQGCVGARFPWESGRDGDDVTPHLYRDRDGTAIPILTGEREEHIVADVAWAAWQYAQWSGDDRFLAGAGRSLIVETALYWASRVQRDPSGRAHLLGVIGPDEYHEIVDDNAFTNVMARWNLRTGADLLDPEGEQQSGPAWEWRSLAEDLVDGLDQTSGRYEQFRGFTRLEPLIIGELVTTPIAADLLLGRDRVKQAQVVKQADVLMLHHLVPDEVAAGSLAPNLDYYLPRTAHGSSLSPAIHASLLARAGRADEGRDLLEVACRLDLDDLTGMTGGGLHLATLGGIWQAIVFGFAGVRARDGVLLLDPRLPRGWERLSLRLRFRGRRLGLQLTNDEIEVRTDGPIRVAPLGSTTAVVTAPVGRFARRGGQWVERMTT